MKMKALTRPLLFILSLALTLSLLSTTVFAEDAEDAEDAADPENEYVDWSVSESGDTIYSGDLIYAVYPYMGYMVTDPLYKYCYYDTVDIPAYGYEDSQVCSYEKNGDYIWVYGNEGYGRIYVNTAGMETLTDFINGDIPIFHLMESGEKRAYMDGSLVTSLEDLRMKGEQEISIDASMLKSVPCYTIAAYEETESFRYDYGAVYLYDGTYYYLNYLLLDNSHFDADGHFSYRSGTVTLTALDAELTASFKSNLDEIETFYIDYTYEEDEIYADDGFDGTFSDNDDFITVMLVFFWITIIFVCFLLPIPFLVLGLVLPHSASRGYPKYWYSVAIIAGVWLLLSVALLIALI